jgi:hypothetical protein
VLFYLFCRYFIEDFCAYVHQGNGCIVFLFVVSIVYQGVLASGWYWLPKMNLEEFLPFPFYEIVGEALVLVFFKSLIKFSSESIQS